MKTRKENTDSKQIRINGHSGILSLLNNLPLDINLLLGIIVLVLSVLVVG